MTPEQLNDIDVLCDNCNERLTARIGRPAAGIPCIKISPCGGCLPDQNDELQKEWEAGLKEGEEKGAEEVRESVRDRIGELKDLMSNLESELEGLQRNGP